MWDEHGDVIREDPRGGVKALNQLLCRPISHLWMDSPEARARHGQVEGGWARSGSEVHMDLGDLTMQLDLSIPPYPPIYTPHPHHSSKARWEPTVEEYRKQLVAAPDEGAAAENAPAVRQQYVPRAVAELMTAPTPEDGSDLLTSADQLMATGR